MTSIEYYDVRVERAEHTNEIVVRGEIVNKTSRTFNSVAVRVILFVKNIAIANMVILINGLASGGSRAFEAKVPDLEYDSIAKEISRYEIYTDSAY